MAANHIEKELLALGSNALRVLSRHIDQMNAMDRIEQTLRDYYPQCGACEELHDQLLKMLEDK